MSKDVFVLPEDSGVAVATREIPKTSTAELGLGGEEFAPWQQLGAML
jgi:hypothetical protein